MDYKVFCPLMEKEIDDRYCFDIHCVVDDGAPEYTAPEKAVNIPNFRDICLKCPNHRFD